MHTATLKSGEGCASKAALGEPGSISLAGTLEEGQEEQGGGAGARAAGKTLGLKKTLPRQSQIQVHGKVKAQQPRPALLWTLLPRCGDTC